MSNKKLYVYVSVVFVLALMLIGCSGTTTPTDTGGGEEPGESGGDVALKITGMVDNKMAWSEDEVRSMDTMDVISTNKDGEESTYTGVSINVLLDKAGVQDGASLVVFVADDGYEAEASLEDIRNCADCIVSFRNKGGFSIVMPGYPGNMQVKGVIEIKVQ